MGGWATRRAHPFSPPSPSLTLASVRHCLWTCVADARPKQTYVQLIRTAILDVSALCDDG